MLVQVLDQLPEIFGRRHVMAAVAVDVRDLAHDPGDRASTTNQRAGGERGVMKPAPSFVLGWVVQVRDQLLLRCEIVGEGTLTAPL